jgi:hypothetical protein
LWKALVTLFPDTAQLRRDVLAAWQARDIAIAWRPEWLLKVVPSTSGLPDEAFHCPPVYRQITNDIPIVFGQSLFHATVRQGPERQQLLEWCDHFRKSCDDILCYLTPEGCTALLGLSHLADRFTRRDDYWCKELGWEQLIEDEAEAAAFDDEHPDEAPAVEWWAERLVEGEEGDTTGFVFANERRAYWHDWLDRVEFIAGDLDEVAQVLRRPPEWWRRTRGRLS